MSNLKELTWEHHERAETSYFAKQLMSGEITPREYQEYLFNQMICYGALEGVVDLPEEYKGVFRANEIFEDMHEIQKEYNLSPIERALNTTVEYVNYIESIRHNNHKLLSHLYVRHFGDLHGGQMISKKVPGSGKYYQFENRYDLIKGLRTLLDDSMADEARICFDFAFRSFEELSQNATSQ
jgi:heme oxygenase